MAERELHIDHGFDPDPDPVVEPNEVPVTIPEGDAPAAQRPARPLPYPVLAPLVEDHDLTDSSPELLPISEFLRSLARAVKSARIYPTNNPIYLRSVTHVLDKLTRAFQEYNLIRVVVGQTRLYFQGEPVYENSDPDDSLARLFFRDGIREISFHIGLEREEMARFLGMIRAAVMREATEDLVTQLWDDSLPHITYTAIDDMLDADLSDNPVPPEFGSDFMNYIDFEVDFSEDVEPAQPTRDEALAAAGEMHRKLLEGAAPDILALTGEERSALDELTREEDVAALTIRVLDTFFEVLNLEPDPAPRENLLSVLESALVSVVTQKQFAPARHILSSLGALGERRPDLARVHQATFSRIHRTASDAVRLEIITEILERQTGHLIQEIEAYLRLLSPVAIPDLCEVLGCVESRRGRRVICGALIHLAGGRIDPFLPFLKDERWFLVRNVLSILGQMKNPSAVKHIRPLVDHSEMRVRREALTALSLIGEREALDALVASLRDADPRIRVSAARSLSRLGRTGLNALLQVVLARTFETRSIEEKRGFFEALGRTNADEILPYLRMLLTKRPLFKKNEAEEMRVCAVEALSRMRLAEARTLLAEAATDPSSLVRAAVVGATRRQSDEEPEDA